LEVIRPSAGEPVWPSERESTVVLLQREADAAVVNRLEPGLRAAQCQNQFPRRYQTDG
jgi:hypothetical protein